MRILRRKKPEIPEHDDRRDLLTSGIQYVKTIHCSEHTKLMRYTRLTCYLIIFNIVYEITQGGMPNILILAFSKILLFVG